MDYNYFKVLLICRIHIEVKKYKKSYNITNIYPVDCFFCFFLKSFAGLKKK